MTEEQLKAFLEAVKCDAGLLEKLNAASDDDADAAAVEIAKAAGFITSAEELMKTAEDTEISEKELVSRPRNL